MNICEQITEAFRAVPSPSEDSWSIRESISEDERSRIIAIIKKYQSTTTLNPDEILRDEATWIDLLCYSSNDIVLFFLPKLLCAIVGREAELNQITRLIVITLFDLGKKELWASINMGPKSFAKYTREERNAICRWAEHIKNTDPNYSSEQDQSDLDQIIARWKA